MLVDNMDRGSLNDAIGSCHVQEIEPETAVRLMTDPIDKKMRWQSFADWTAINLSYESVCFHIKHCPVKEGKRYSYRGNNDRRVVFKFEGVKIVALDEWLVKVLLRFTGQDSDGSPVTPFRPGYMDFRSLRSICRSRGVRIATHEDIRKSKRFVAKELLNQTPCVKGL